MRPFAYARAFDGPAAVRAASIEATQTRYLAGGTTLLDLMKLDVERPARIIDVSALSRDPSLSRIEADGRGLRLGAFALMSAVAEDGEVKARFPLVAQSLALAASAQLRNMATLGGNVLQRTRCPYFRDTSYAACNKRMPGSGCSAVDGFNRLHAVLGINDSCIASYPGDFAQALIALDARVQIIGPEGQREIAFADLHRGPEDPARENNLKLGELITGFTAPAGDYRRSMYLKIRDRQSYAFAVASAAVVLMMNGDRVHDARIALGGLAYRPWRAAEAETILKGKPFSEDLARQAAERAFAGATTHEHNAYKVALGKETLTRALAETASMEIRS
jgi:xanthine dehydrogenase YagS FAD-binding subunit